MPRKIVRVVTPTSPTASSIAAFQDQLTSPDKDGWDNLDYDVCSANDDNANLETAAINASSAVPDVILADGSYAADLLQKYVQGSTCKIVMVGGVVPDPVPANLTGFSINSNMIALYHLNKMPKETTVLYDPNNVPSCKIFQNVKDAAKPKSINLTELKITDPGDFNEDNKPETEGFMLIPNAMFYYYCTEIAGMVDDNTDVKLVYYPEREYKDAHKKHKNKAKVHGHAIPEIFRAAADLVSDILHDKYAIGELPPMYEGRKYKDD